MKHLFLKGSRAAVPALWHLEMGNALVLSERRSILSSADVDRALIDLEEIVAQVVDTDSSLVSVRQSMATARAFHLSTYDAAYLDLARREHLPLATLDEQLRAAANARTLNSVLLPPMTRASHPCFILWLPCGSTN